MSPHRRPSDSAGSSAALLAKYQELLRKHESLVRRLETRNNEHISTWTLSSWGLETSSSGLALLQGNTLQMANRRWYTLAQEPARWRTLGDSAPGAGLPLREVALVESRNATSGTGPHVVRHQLEDGSRTLELRVDRVHGGPGALPRMLVLALDITEQVQAERELARVRATLAEQEQLRGLGEMVAGLVHDLSGTLEAMRLRLELIERDTEFAVRQRAHLDALARIVGDATTRVHHLKTFSQQQPEPLAHERVQLSDVVREAVNIAGADLEQRAAQQGLTLRVDARVTPLPLVNGSATDLRYVFINLLINARDAMPHGGTIRVRGQVEDQRAVLTVADDGTGIPEEHLHTIFRPFFTTKGAKGTGLGLSMAYGVVSRAGGTIVATNRPEGGALFTLSFPLSAPATPPKRPPRRKPPRRSKRSPRG